MPEFDFELNTNYLDSSTNGRVLTFEGGTNDGTYSFGTVGGKPCLIVNPVANQRLFTNKVTQVRYTRAFHVYISSTATQGTTFQIYAGTAAISGSQPQGTSCTIMNTASGSTVTPVAINWTGNFATIASDTIISGGTFAYNTWHSIVITSDVSFSTNLGILNIYLDSVQVVTATNTDLTWSGTATGFECFGGVYPAQGRVPTCNIRAWKHWDYPLTQVQITALFSTDPLALPMSIQKESQQTELKRDPIIRSVSKISNLSMSLQESYAPSNRIQSTTADQESSPDCDYPSSQETTPPQILRSVNGNRK
jgi:hypothetical protein